MFSRTNTRPRAFWLWLAVFIIVVLVAAPEARGQSPRFANGAAIAPAATEANDIDLLVGRSTVLNLGAPIARVSLTVPDVADALVTAPQQILIHGKSPGTISLFVWEKTGAIRTFEVKVRRDLAGLGEQLQTLFPGEKITATQSGKDVVLAGSVKSQYVIDKAAEVAAGYVDKKENVVNLLKMQTGIASNQVMLRVRFAEVSRSAMQELGVNTFSDGWKQRFGSTTTQQFAAPFFDQRGPMLGDTLVFSDYLNLFLFDAKNHLGAVVKALQGRGLFQSLAEPNLVATDGKEASFLAGGEYPYPVANVAGGATSISITFKEFGIRLNFTPQIMGDDLIHLKLRPEVSSLDFTNAVIISGFRIPALVTRRTETEIELRDGQTFAVAGLLNNTATSTMRKIPGIGDIPILGLLFKSRAYQKDQTELVVMITPVILKRGSTGVSEGLPNLVEPYMGKPPQTIPPPAPYTGSPRYGAQQPKSQTANQPQQLQQPVAQQPVAPPLQQLSDPGDSSRVIADTPRSQPAAARPAAAPAAQPTPSGSRGTVVEQVQSTPTVAPPPQQPQKLTKKDIERIEAEQREQQKQRELEARKQAEADRRAAEAQRAADKVARKQAAEAQKRQAADAKVALQKAQEEQKKVEEVAREQAKRDLEAAKKAEQDRARADAEKKKAEQEQAKLAAEQAKRAKAVAEAEAKVKSAQAAYEAVVRSGEDPTKKPIKPPQEPEK